MVVWDEIDTVLLDMDGTLLDLYFDNYFWQEYLPLKWGEINNLNLPDAKAMLAPKFENKVGTLSWYCVDYWSEQLDVDVMALKSDIEHLIQIRPYSEPFLEHLNNINKHLVMVTNAHEKLIELKMDKTCIDKHFDKIFSAHGLGAPKEDLDFWERLSQQISFLPERTMLIDDNLMVLRCAKEYGIRHLFTIEQPDSQSLKRNSKEFIAITSFNHMIG